ncbi:RPAP1-like protein [Neurospora tetraspora]|uniref:RPAP1-like protein n=1 Tax=Neurospora tetraspora TaxID=94610 RepID=A0AAE0JGK4_9PEZI|nr:RPAP1-like protein [Neurospora tetraspora]
MDGTLEILDVKERAVGEVKPPSFPTPPSASSGGFPAPKKRVSAFKKQRQQQADPSSSSSQATSSTPSPSIKFTSGAKPQIDADPIKSEKQRIDEENNKLLSSMSPEEIAEAQRELFNGLDPRLIQMLLRRANVEDGSNNNDPKVWDIPEKPAEEPTEKKADDSGPRISYKKPPSIKTSTSKSAYVEDEQEEETKETEQPKKPKKTVTFNEDLAPEQPPPGSFPIRTKQPPTPYPQKTCFSAEDLATPTFPTAGSSSEPQTPTTPCSDPSHNHSDEELKGVHFPAAPAPPDLDPSDPDFLSTLHQKFFPSLPADPSKLAWMAPLPTEDSPADQESPYYPGQSSLPVSALRFDFKGSLIPPRLSRQIPVSKGLHHHGEAPEAAGYTIPELARLARSSVNSQRCIAFRTLGRMLYRLGKGEWGTGAGGRDGEGDDLAFALWRCFQEGRVLESIGEAAGVEEGVGSVSVRAYAIEAMWLFEKGGWKEKWRGL